MSDKTIQERLRYAGAINDDADCFWVDSDLLREAADLIDRLTAAPSEDVVERVAIALWLQDTHDHDRHMGYALTSEDALISWDANAKESYRSDARAAIAAMPSVEQIRHDEREKCIAVISSLAELRGRQECCGVGEYSGNGGPPECCAKPLLMIETNEAIAAIRARNEEK